MCDATVTLLLELMEKGNSSNFAPYLNFLYSSEENPSIPSTWSSAGKSLLKTIQGPLIPQDIADYSFVEDCLDGDEKIHEDQILLFETAYAIALTRNTGEKFIPILDMFNHRYHANIVAKFVHDSQLFVLVAKRNIEQGEELFMNYRDFDRDSDYHVSTLFQDFGFVEDYRQQWLLPTPKKRSNIEANEIPAQIRFEIFKTGSGDDVNDDIQSVMNNYGIRWIKPEQPVANPIVADHLKKELSRLKEISSVVKKRGSMLTSESERETIFDYYQSLSIAYMVAIASVEEAIELSPGIVEEEGDKFMACEDFYAIHEGTDGWEYEEGTESSHQEIEYYYNPETRDACLFLEEYLHACVSNRPHYHEVFVHYPAYFLEKVERVLFIGGGDSMVLHEVLKYDDQLELVVGLELDQHVVRASYSLIGTQPHFDNEKVEWWFGDAAEALNVLPREYYGTFDLVVVDILSEVAESLEVTDEVTIMEAAMMLMKPTGIIVKNEDEGYVPGSTDSTTFTDYTVDIMYYDVPVYCLQTFVMGSNSIDFSTANPNDHKISNFYLKDIDEFQSQFDTWYTSGKESSDEGQNENIKDANSKESPNTSAMTMIIEAEEISVPFLESASSIQGIIEKCAEMIGFTVMKSLQRVLVESYTLTSILEEAAVSARCFPQKKYCAIDVQFWKSVDKAESMKKTILSELGSEENSVFRLVTTGVFGVEENDNNSNIGPPSKNSALNTGSPPQDGSEKSEDRSGIHTSFVQRKNLEIDFKNATFEDYDSSSGLEQWHSQKTMGFQNIGRFEIPFRYHREQLKQLVVEVISGAIESVQKQQQEDKAVDPIIVEDLEIGKGIVVVLTWSEGDLIALWDGEENLNINMFSSERSFLTYSNSIAKGISNYVTMDSVDFFPRGTGRTVSFPRDVTGKEGERKYPFWAPDNDDDYDDDDDYDEDDEETDGAEGEL